MEQSKLLLAIQAATAKPIQPIIVDSTLEEIAEADNSIVLFDAVINLQEPLLRHYAVGKSNLARTTPLPCVITQMQYQGKAFKSTTREDFGQPVSAVNTIIHGYPVQMDAENKPLYETVKIGDTEVERPLLITTDSEGNETGPIQLQVWAWEWGTDYNASYDKRLANQDQLYCRNREGVVEKLSEKQSEDSDAKSFYRPDWSYLHGIEDLMKAPFLNPPAGLDMAPLLELIPIASSAPSRKLAQARTSTLSARVVTRANGDVFAKAPEEEKSKSKRTKV